MINPETPLEKLEERVNKLMMAVGYLGDRCQIHHGIHSDQTRKQALAEVKQDSHRIAEQEK